MCHDPPISDDIVKVEEKEWFCSKCDVQKHGLVEFDPSKGISGERMSEDEVIYHEFFRNMEN